MNLTDLPRRLIGVARHICLSGKPGQEWLEVGPASLVIEPGRESEFPSANPNRAWIRGDVALGGDDLARIEAEYSSRGVEKCFLWLLPGDKLVANATVLVGRGWQMFNGPRYLVLAREPVVSVTPDRSLEVRRLCAEDVKSFSDALQSMHGGDAARDGFTATVGMPGYDHFAVFDDGKPIAAALVVTVDGLSWLGYAATHPDHRKRGAHRHLIAARLDHAKSIGSDLCVSETLSFLENSLGNLRHAGFEIAFAAAVFEKA